VKKTRKSTNNVVKKLVSYFVSFYYYVIVYYYFKCGVGGGRWASYDRYFSYPAKILEKGCPTWPDNRGCTVLLFKEALSWSY